MHIHEPVAVTCLVGIAGAVVPEILRTIAALRAERTPTWREFVASGLTALLGLGVLLFDTSGDSWLEIAVLGAAFPQIFSGLVAAAAKPSNESGGALRGRPTHRRSVWDYLAWRI